MKKFLIPGKKVSLLEKILFEHCTETLYDATGKVGAKLVRRDGINPILSIIGLSFFVVLIIVIFK